VQAGDKVGWLTVRDGGGRRVDKKRLVGAVDEGVPMKGPEM
jgi:hypothetical protein